MCVAKFLATGLTASTMWDDVDKLIPGMYAISVAKREEPAGTGAFEEDDGIIDDE